MLNIEVEGNEFLLGAFSVVYGVKKLFQPKEDCKACSLVSGVLLTAAGIAAMVGSVQAWMDAGADADDWDDEEA